MVKLGTYYNKVCRKLQDFNKSKHADIVGKELKTLSLAILSAGYEEFTVTGETRSSNSGEVVKFRFNMEYIPEGEQRGD